MRPRAEREIRTIKFSLRVTESEYQSLAAEADICGLSCSALLRQRGIENKNHIVAKTDLRMVAEIRRIGGLLKHIHNETKGVYSEQTAEAIREITRFVRLLNEERMNVTGNKENDREDTGQTR